MPHNYDYYTDMRFGDGRNYHISLDSGALGIDKCVDILADVVKMSENNDK